MPLDLPAVRRGFVNVPHGQVHYRYAGHGPPVVLLHDSPRSSVMHRALLQELSQNFTAIAIDTPGYGLSTPLPADPRPEMADFARALADTLEALGIERCPIYGFHTSSKTTLQFAIDHPDRVSLAIIEGLSLPPGGPSEDFITQYMKPFVLSEDGSHLAATWSKARDIFRFFPWFDKSARARLPLDFPDDRFLHGSVLDMLMSGEHYSVAYSAAMRYLALPKVATVRAPTVFMCRENDPLYVYLDSLPKELPAGCSIERLTSDPDAWRARLIELFTRASDRGGDVRLPDALARPRLGETRGYVTLPHGQIALRRYGPTDSAARPLLMLHESPGSSVALPALAASLAEDRVVYAIDLPGVGESDPLSTPDAASYADALLRLIDALGLPSVDVYAECTSSSLAMQLARQASNRIHALVLDAVPLLTSAERRALWKQYCPAIAPRWDGGHLLTLWHRLRDQELSWPWSERGSGALRRRTADLGGRRLHDLVVDLAKQPAHYGDAALAGIEVDVKALLREISQPVLLLEASADIRYASVPKVARALPSATRSERADRPEDRAAAILKFLRT